VSTTPRFAAIGNIGKEAAPLAYVGKVYGDSFQLAGRFIVCEQVLFCKQECPASRLRSTAT